MRWHNGGNEKVRIWSIFNTLFVHMERKCGERKRPTCFYLFYNKKDFFFFSFVARDTFKSTMRSSFLLWEWVHFLQTFFVLHFPLFYTQTWKRYVFFSFFFFLFHLLNNWGKRKKTQNLIEIWFSCAIYNQLWVEDFMND